MADIAMRKNVTEDVIDFLKEVAYNEGNDEVRTAAYANLNLIRETYPLEKKGDLELSVIGDIRKGNNITIVMNISSTAYIDEATVGIKRIADFGDEGAEGIELKTRNPVHLPMKAGESKEVRFDIYLGKEGKFMILSALKLSFDRVDYQIIEKEIHLEIGKDSGTFKII